MHGIFYDGFSNYTVRELSYLIKGRMEARLDAHKERWECSRFIAGAFGGEYANVDFPWEKEDRQSRLPTPEELRSDIDRILNRKKTNA